MRPAISPTKCVQVLKGTPPAEWSWAATEPKLDAAGKSAQIQFLLQENNQRIQAMPRQQRANQRIVGESGLLPNANQTLLAPMAWPNFSSRHYIYCSPDRSKPYVFIYKNLMRSYLLQRAWNGTIV